MPPFDVFNLAKPSKSQHTVILIHGYLSSGACFDAFSTHLEARLREIDRNVQVHAYPGYDSTQSLDAAAVAIAAHVREMNRNEVTLIGHSLGGLVAANVARLLLTTENDGIVVRGVIAIDSPFFHLNPALLLEPHGAVATVHRGTERWRQSSRGAATASTAAALGVAVAAIGAVARFRAPLTPIFGESPANQVQRVQFLLDRRIPFHGYYMAADGTSSSSFINLPAALPAHIRALFTPIAMAHPDSAILAHMSIFDESAHPTQYQALVDSVADEICAWNETTSGGAATTLFGGQSWSAGIVVSSVNPNFSFEPNQQSLKMPYLVVNNLSEITTDADLSTEFAKFGTVALVSLNPTCSRATVGMPNTESAVGAIAALNGRKLKGNIISVEDATDRTHLVQASSLSDHATKYDVERHFSGQLALEQFNGDLHVALLRAHDAKAKQEAIRRFNGTPMSGQAVRVEDFDALNGPAQEQQQQQQQQQHQEPPKKGQWWRPLAVTGLGVLSVALVGPVLAVGAVQALGFGAGGIVAGSAAAGMMSGAGTVAAGSGIALLQSVGATGTLLWSGSAMAATAGVAAAAGAAAAAASGDGEEEKKEEEKKEEEKKEEEKKEE